MNLCWSVSLYISGSCPLKVFLDVDYCSLFGEWIVIITHSVCARVTSCDSCISELYINFQERWNVRSFLFGG